jgi:hypothetical protein
MDRKVDIVTWVKDHRERGRGADTLSWGMSERVVPLDPKLNPGFLKLDLYCRGLRLHESLRADEDGGRPLLRTRAGLGSGLEVVLPQGLWTNVPVLEDFASESPYELRRGEGRGGAEHVIWRDGEPIAPVRLAPKPAWYDGETTKGRPLRRVGTLPGTYLGVYASRLCEFWVEGPTRASRENCRFCSVGLNLGVDDAGEKDVDEILEVVHAARRESGITYVDFNTGHADEHDFLDLLEPVVTRVKRETGLLVGVQSPPHPDLSRYARLKALGVNRVSFCFEIWDRPTFERVCPGKAKAYGLDRYLEVIEHCASLSDPSKPTLSPWVTNGEIIAGLEPPESSIEAIDWLTERGAIPTVCVFRPLKGTDLEDLPSPRTDDMVPVFTAFWTRCMERGLPIGIAPNIHVSLVMLPEECRWLVQDEAVLERLRAAEKRLAWKRRAFRMAWGARSALRRVAASA